MHLLNNPSASPDSSSSYHPPPDLPPIQSFSSFAKASNYSLPPLEPDAGNNHHGASTTGDKAAAKPVHHIRPLASINEEYNAGRYHEAPGGAASGSRQPSGGISLRMLFDPEVNESTHSLTHILDDVPEPSTAASEDASTKKRHRAMTVKDDIMHLPQPLKKQKSSQNIMPPIINGLYEPPPNAAVFPPIALDDGNEAVAAASLNTLKEYPNSSVNPNSVDVSDVPEKIAPVVPAPEKPNVVPEAEKPLPKVKRKAAKPRKKWSEEETRHLLLGVNKHGVGKWTSILEDREYRFNGRTAGDLKDRFRTCCPDELRVVPSKSRESLRQQDKTANTPPPDSRSKGKSKTGLLLEYILADPEDPIPGNQSTEDLSTVSLGQAGTSQQDLDLTAKPKKSRAHRKKIEDLQAMGIHGPFKKSHRRERRPFTQQDDDQILEGLQLYGPAWTKIQRDPRFNLSSRQPTDLRDRVRNKYPEMYKQIEEKQLHNKDSPAPSSSSGAAPAGPALRTSRSNNVLEPSVNAMLNENSYMTLEPHLNRAGVRQEDLPAPTKWTGGSAASLPSAGGITGNGGSGSFQELPGLDSFSRDPTLEEVDGVGEQSGSAAVFGMMDISRLLLD